ncbi:recombinase family protein [Bradyrhizobium sp.]|uniref:recombinase family protein n=1 Tax=Bradyrhizobium sp. TaxID=376 RepID=UPI0025C07809|nr:recombinase family protein [Bradyrhizobium sp.]
MVNALVVRRNTHPAKAQRALRAAQYVRMSTERQRYSIQNQAAAIAVYAAQHDLLIVRTYSDEGQSGLRIRNRPGLIDLINDVVSGRADFDHVLVYDVSRWGRFQDVDESAHYEFVCKQAGVKVAYCAEQFDNDGSLLSSIVKNLKRVMAAEYSRELSVKVHAGACRVASLGFRAGATPGYGLRRELVDENGCPKGPLQKGQRKHLQTDRVILRPGPQHELDIVRRVFRNFVRKGHSQEKIARQLNLEHVPNHRGKPWNGRIVHHLLQNENYIGNIVYNRKSFRLRQVMRSNPPEHWVRGTGGFEPIIEDALFWKAQRLLKQQYVRRSDQQLLERLRDALTEKGRLSATVMGRMSGMPCAGLYALRFGSLRKAFDLIGYRSQRNCEFIDSRPLLNTKLVERASDVARRIRALGASAIFDAAAHTLSIDDRLAVSFRIARYYPNSGRVPVWHVHRRAQLPPGLLLALRLDKENSEIVDYFLIPTTEMNKFRISLREKCRYSRFEKYQVSSLEGVIQKIMETVGTATQASAPTAAKSKKPRQSARTREATGRARH